jgi:spore coat protein CotF
MSLHVPKEMTHYNEMNDQIVNIDIDMNMRDIARNAM